MEEIFSAEEIKAAVKALALEVDDWLMARENAESLLIVAILEGALRFAADLKIALQSDSRTTELTTLGLSSYGSGKIPDDLSVTSQIPMNVKGRTILLVDDIADTGNTLLYARGYLNTRGASDIVTAVLLDKHKLDDGRRKALEPIFSGLSCPDRFVVGYGMDLDGSHRELDVIAAID